MAARDVCRTPHEATSATKFALPDATFDAIEKQLELGRKSIESVLKGGKAAVDWAARSDDPTDTPTAEKPQLKCG